MIAITITFGVANSAQKTLKEGDTIVIKEGTKIVGALVGHGDFHATAYENVIVVVKKDKSGKLYFCHENFPHNCPFHGLEDVDEFCGPVPKEYEVLQ